MIGARTDAELLREYAKVEAEFLLEMKAAATPKAPPTARMAWQAALSQADQLTSGAIGCHRDREAVAGSLVSHGGGDPLVVQALMAPSTRSSSRLDTPRMPSSNSARACRSRLCRWTEMRPGRWSGYFSSNVTTSSRPERGSPLPGRGRSMGDARAHGHRSRPRDHASAVAAPDRPAARGGPCQGCVGTPRHCRRRHGVAAQLALEA